MMILYGKVKFIYLVLKPTLKNKQTNVMHILTHIVLIQDSNKGTFHVQNNQKKKKVYEKSAPQISQLCGFTMFNVSQSQQTREGDPGWKTPGFSFNALQARYRPRISACLNVSQSHTETKLINSTSCGGGTCPKASWGFSPSHTCKIYFPVIVKMFRLKPFGWSLDETESVFAAQQLSLLFNSF